MDFYSTFTEPKLIPSGLTPQLSFRDMWPFGKGKRKSKHNDEDEGSGRQDTSSTKGFECDDVNADGSVNMSGMNLDDDPIEINPTAEIEVRVLYK